MISPDIRKIVNKVFLLIAVWTCGPLVPCLAADEVGPPISDKQLNIAFTLPDGFEPIPEFTSPAGMDIRYAFQRESLDGQPPTCIFIQCLRGVIGREPIPEEVFKKMGDVHHLQMKWKSFDVDAFVVKEQANGNRFVTWNVQLPVKPRAIQLKVFGLESREDEIASLTRTLVGSLDAPSNWLTNDERAQRLGEGIGKMTVWILGIGATVFGLVRWRETAFRRRAAARGIPMEVANQKIRPGWWWYLLPAYLVFAALAAMGVMVFMYSGHEAALYSLGILCSGLVAASAIAGIIMWRRVLTKRRIMAVQMPPALWKP